MNLRWVLHLLLLLWLTIPSATAAPSLAKTNCTASCGNVTSIPYPFGIGKGCYLDEWYEITCNTSVSPNKPFLRQFNLEVLNITMDYPTGKLTLNTSIASNCPSGEATASSNVWTSSNFKGSPFNFSQERNELAVVGCDNALLSYEGEILAGCTSKCASDINTTGCFGINCCQTSIPRSLDSFNLSITDNTTQNCTYGFLVDKDWFPGNLTNPYAIRNLDHVPTVMDWTIADFSKIEPSRNSYCPFQGSISNVLYNYCYCRGQYEGNPYIPNGCQVIEVCAKCKKECDRRYTPKGDWEYFCHNSNKTEIILGSSLGGGVLLLLLCGFVFWLYKYLKRRRIMKLKQKFFKRNGGLLLQQQLSSEEGIVEKTKIFSSKELEKATDNFNMNRVLGQGGQGTVYKGMLTDGKIVAVKKSKVVDESQIEQFINEVVILSQINHRNIVKLFGCCLETEVPLLVYEFIPNGNLFQLIHDQIEDFPFSWKMRLQVATEVAGALAYLHSASSMPIYHRDVKSTNILLDEKYRAKVSDFGTSRSIAIEQTHLTTLVHGTFGYLDPEYFQSSQYTEKSDVYSFGVVLVELLTGQKAISSIRSEEEKSLATRFILSLKENRLFDLVDARVIKEARHGEILAVADIAKRCLSLNGKKRPTMKEVMMELEGIRMSHMPPNVTQKFREDVCIIEMNRPFDNASTSTSTLTGLDSSRSFSSGVDPLLIGTF